MSKRAWELVECVEYDTKLRIITEVTELALDVGQGEAVGMASKLFQPLHPDISGVGSSSRLDHFGWMVEDQIDDDMWIKGGKVVEHT